MISAVLLLVSLLSGLAECDDGINWESKLFTVFKSNARFKEKWCSKEEFDDKTLNAVYSCQFISVLDSVKVKKAHESCRTVVFGSRGSSLRYVRRQLCDSRELRKFYIKCLMDIHWKEQPHMMESLTQTSSRREALIRVLPMVLERQNCQNDALNIDLYNNNDSNDVDHTMVDKSGDLAILFASVIRKKT